MNYETASMSPRGTHLRVSMRKTHAHLGYTADYCERWHSPKKDKRCWKQYRNAQYKGA